ncbi:MULTISPECIES: polyisoprenyl-teichoic acid--peptidoglycan teichoic acid transferase TagU [Bacillus]|uniref:Polyisoprenyl-teichoic acid--peptidoglycan teichoic acid transferase TagU n=2 Tax=Bacillus TaxID=1386 RepID=A0A0M4FSJ6_9BACI|nr:MULTISPECIES: LytR family transcriptional regulator [Bacillus]ALC82521.1 trascriptional regulator [Bacillus gobiensis]MBP1081424.1 LCP family protein required for cell wall assembly [Bacillus capparidis]MED1096096.1 LytR family transcriptional regulator [Bacillus capparidis]
MRAEKKRKKKKKVLAIVLSIIGIFILVAGGYAYFLWDKAAKTVASINEEINPSDRRVEKVDVNKKDPVSVLIMGVDERSGDSGRSDSLIYMAINPQTKTTEMVSIPRDTYTELVGKGTMDKINHSYAYGGTQMTIDTVENFLDVPVDYFVKVNMESFRDIVDTLGGVTVNSTFAFDYDGYSFNEGQLDLNGKEALAYSRMRYDDPRGDFGRQDRQRQVIEGIIDKGANISSITKFGDMFNVVEDNVKTNLSFDNMWDIQSNYKQAADHVVQHELKGTGGKIGGVYYYQVNEDDRLAISKELKENLEMDKTASKN